MKEVGESENLLLKKLLSTWNNPEQNAFIFQTPPLTSPAEDGQQNTFIIKTDVTEQNPKMTEALQDYSLINRNKELYSREESSRDISQYFR